MGISDLLFRWRVLDDAEAEVRRYQRGLALLDARQPTGDGYDIWATAFRSVYETRTAELLAKYPALQQRLDAPSCEEPF